MIPILQFDRLAPEDILNRDIQAEEDVSAAVDAVLAAVKAKGDAALKAYTKQFNGVEFPERYYAQCVHYLAVTGLDRWYLAVLVFGRGFFTYTLERDEAEISALMEAEKPWYLSS